MERKMSNKTIQKGIKHFTYTKDNKREMDFRQPEDVICLLTDWKLNGDYFTLTHQYYEKFDDIDGKWYPVCEWKCDVIIDGWEGRFPRLFFKKVYDEVEFKMVQPTFKQEGELAYG